MSRVTFRQKLYPSNFQKHTFNYIQISIGQIKHFGHSLLLTSHHIFRHSSKPNDSIIKSSSNWSIIRKSKPKHKAPKFSNLPLQYKILTFKTSPKPNQIKFPKPYTHKHKISKFLIEKGKCKIPFEIVW